MAGAKSAIVAVALLALMVCAFATLIANNESHAASLDRATAAKRIDMEQPQPAPVLKSPKVPKQRDGSCKAYYKYEGQRYEQTSTVCLESTAACVYTGTAYSNCYGASCNVRCQSPVPKPLVDGKVRLPVCLAAPAVTPPGGSSVLCAYTAYACHYLNNRLADCMGTGCKNYCNKVYTNSTRHHQPSRGPHPQPQISVNSTTNEKEKHEAEEAAPAATEAPRSADVQLGARPMLVDKEQAAQVQPLTEEHAEPIDHDSKADEGTEDGDEKLQALKQPSKGEKAKKHKKPKKCKKPKKPKKSKKE